MRQPQEPVERSGCGERRIFLDRHHGADLARIRSLYFQSRLAEENLPRRADRREAHPWQRHFHVGPASEDLRDKLRRLGKHAIPPFHHTKQVRTVSGKILHDAIENVMQFGHRLFAGFFASRVDPERIECLVHPSDASDHWPADDGQIRLIDEEIFGAQLIHVAGVEFGHEGVVKVAFDLRRHMTADDGRICRKPRRGEVPERRVAVEHTVVEFGLVHRLERQAAKLHDADQETALGDDEVVIDVAQVRDMHLNGLFPFALAAIFKVSIDAHGE